MPARPRFAWFDGRLVPFAEARVPIDDRGLQFGESLYEVAPVTGGRVRLLREHVERMQKAAPELGLERGVPALGDWERLTAELLGSEPVDEGLLYAQVTGGAAPREHAPSVPPSPAFFAYVIPFRFPRDPEVKRGTRAVTLPDLRWARRDLKTTMLLPAVLAKREAKRRGADEALLHGTDGLVHEGASSNVFIVEENRVVTPAQTTSLLPGTMRPLVVQVARAAGFDVRAEPVAMDRVRNAREVFVSSSSQLAMPVISLDERPVGDGVAGPVVLELARRLRAELQIPD